MTARKETADRPHRRSFEPVMTFTREGLVLGGTVLAPLRSERDGAPKSAISGAEERILALLAVAYGKTAQSGVLGRIRRATRYWHRGEQELAAIEIALTGLPPLVHKEQAAARLYLGETLLAAGLGARELIELCGLDPAPLDILKAGYNPDEPRVPAANPDGGQWTSDGGGTSSVADGAASPAEISRPDPGIGLVSYTPVHGLPDDAVVVKTPAGETIADPASKTKKLMAPPHADFRKVYAAGRAIAGIPVLSQIPLIRLALAQGGTYDFQRDPVTGHFYHAYTNASNYAVGVFMAGAGYSLPSTGILAESYALLFSSNYGSLPTIKWIAQGWGDATAGSWK